METVAPVVNPESTSNSRNRAKKRKLLSKISDQMEFYLSDSNIKQSQFMREKLIAAKPIKLDTPGQEADTSKVNEESNSETRIGLELNLFMTFNCIKAMASTEMVKNALRVSKVLELYQKDEVWYVSRLDWRGLTELNGFIEKLDANSIEFEKRTVYCEGLPISANQQWLKRIFSQFGKINLVSLPTFKGHRKIKQFCFVEFANEKSVENMTNYFRQFNGVLCYKDTQPDELLSIQTFQNDDTEGGKKKDNKEADDNKTEEKEDPKPSVEPLQSEGTLPQENNSTGKKPRKKKKNKKNKPTVLEEAAPKENTNSLNKPASTFSDKKAVPELTDDMIYDLKIMTKTEWRRLRNKYLNLQREFVKEMKRQAFQNRQVVAPVEKRKQLAETPEEKQSGTEEDAPKLKRRRRGREKIKKAIKKNSHVFFEPEKE